MNYPSLGITLVLHRQYLPGHNCYEVWCMGMMLLQGVLWNACFVLNILVFFFSEIAIKSACLVESNSNIRVEWIVSTQKTKIKSGDFS